MLKLLQAVRLPYTIKSKFYKIQRTVSSLTTGIVKFFQVSEHFFNKMHI